MIVNADFFEGVNRLITNFTSNTDYYIIVVIWILLFFGVYSIFWAFFLRVNNNIKTGDLISRLLISCLLFYFLWFIIDLLHINIVVNN